VKTEACCVFCWLIGEISLTDARNAVESVMGASVRGNELEAGARNSESPSAARWLGSSLPNAGRFAQAGLTNNAASLIAATAPSASCVALIRRKISTASCSVPCRKPLTIYRSWLLSSLRASFLRFSAQVRGTPMSDSYTHS